VARAWASAKRPARPSPYPGSLSDGDGKLATAGRDGCWQCRHLAAHNLFAFCQGRPELAVAFQPAARAVR
jgi:hypothetical protein